MYGKNLSLASLSPWASRPRPSPRKKAPSRSAHSSSSPITTRVSEPRKRTGNSWGGGGRLGYFFSPTWELELDGSANATDVNEFFSGFASTALAYYPFHLRLNFNQRLGDNSPFTWILGAGPAYNRYGKRVAVRAGFQGRTTGASAALTGIRAMLTNWLAFRLDGTLDYIPSPNNGKTRSCPGQGITAAEPADKNINSGVPGRPFADARHVQPRR